MSENPQTDLDTDTLTQALRAAVGLAPIDEEEPDGDGVSDAAALDVARALGGLNGDPIAIALNSTELTARARGQFS